MLSLNTEMRVSVYSYPDILPSGNESCTTSRREPSDDPSHLILLAISRSNYPQLCPSLLNLSLSSTFVKSLVSTTLSSNRSNCTSLRNLSRFTGLSFGKFLIHNTLSPHSTTNPKCSFFATISIHQLIHAITFSSGSKSFNTNRCPELHTATTSLMDYHQCHSCDRT